MDRSGAFGRQGHDKVSVQGEVYAPVIIPGIEQRDEDAGFRIFDPGGAPFPKIAANASVGKVQGDRFAAVFSTKDVIEVVRVKRVVFVEQAILTSPTGTIRDESAEPLRNAISQLRGDAARELWP